MRKAKDEYVYERQTHERDRPFLRRPLLRRAVALSICICIGRNNVARQCASFDLPPPDLALTRNPASEDPAASLFGL